MDDLIRRYDAIEVVGAIWAVTGDVNVAKAWDQINSLPSAQQEVHDRNVGEWDMFELITSAYYGKMMYAKQENGIIYSRYSGKYMQMDEAIKEFLVLIGD